MNTTLNRFVIHIQKGNDRSAVTHFVWVSSVERSNLSTDTIFLNCVCVCVCASTGHGGEPQRADEHPQQSPWQSWVCSTWRCSFCLAILFLLFSRQLFYQLRCHRLNRECVPVFPADCNSFEGWTRSCWFQMKTWRPTVSASSPAGAWSRSWTYPLAGHGANAVTVVTAVVVVVQLSLFV